MQARFPLNMFSSSVHQTNLVFARAVCTAPAKAAVGTNPLTPNHTLCFGPAYLVKRAAAVAGDIRDVS